MATGSMTPDPARAGQATELAATIERLTELDTQAAPGPWKPCGAMDESRDDCGLIWSLPCDGVVAKAWSQGNMPELGGESFYRETMIANAHLIAEMRNALPTLLSALRTQAAEAERYRAALQSLHEHAVKWNDQAPEYSPQQVLSWQAAMRTQDALRAATASAPQPEGGE